MARRGNRRPNVPQSERRLKMRILDWSAMLRDSFPDRCRRSFETQLDKARVVEGPLNDSAQRSQHKAVAPSQWRRKRPTFGVRAEVAGTEHDRNEMRDIVAVERATAGQADFDRFPRGLVKTRETRRQRCRIIGDDDVQTPQKIRE